ncbi:MAG: carboxypeptidase-like regulatory domain-containing protein [Planctomycetota bacterium]
MPPARRPVLLAVATTVTVILGVFLIWRGTGGPGSQAPAPQAGEGKSLLGPSPDEGAAPEGHDADAGVALERVPVDLDIPRATGRVLSRERHSITGASIVSFVDDASRMVSLASAAPGTHRATSAADGRFSVALGAGEPLFSLVVTARGYSPQVVSFVRAGDDVTVTLQPSRSLWGTVYDMDANPIPGALVRWLALLGGATLERESVADENGRYRILDLPSVRDLGRDGKGISRWWVEARAEGFAPLLVEQSDYPSTPDADIHLDLVLVTGATLHGRVVDGVTNAPIAGAHVELRSLEGLSIFDDHDGRTVVNPYSRRGLGDAVTGADGSFELSQVPAEGHHPSAALQLRDRSVAYVLAEAAGYAPASEGISLPSPGATVEVTIRCLPQASVRGRVLDATGTPLEWVKVWTRSPDARQEGWWFPYDPPAGVARTGADGEYMLRVGIGTQEQALELRADFMLRSRSYGHGSSSTSAGAATKTVCVRPGQMVTAPDFVIAVPSAVLLVVDREGHPVWGARACFEHARDYAFRPPERSDRNGRLRLFFGQRERLVNPGPIVVRAKGFAPAAIIAFEPSPTEPPEIQVVLDPAHELRGSVCYEDGSPVANVWVEAVNAAVPPDEAFPANHSRLRKPHWPPLVYYGWTRSREDGRFELGDLPEGPYLLNANSRPPYLGPSSRSRDTGFSVTLGGVPTDATNVLLTVPNRARAALPGPTGIIEGVVRDVVSGEALRKFTVKLASDGDRSMSKPNSAPGRFYVDRVPLGTWSVSIASAGYVTSEPESVVLVQDGDRAALEFTLWTGASVSGRVACPTDIDVSRLVLWFHAMERSESPSCTVAADGSFRATGFGPGCYRARVQSSVLLAPVSPVEVIVTDAYQDRWVDLALVKAGTLFVDVSASSLAHEGRTESGTSEQRRATESARLVVLRLPEAVVVEECGRIEDGGPYGWWLAPGDYLVKLVVDSAVRAEQTATVREGEETRVVLEVP